MQDNKIIRNALILFVITLVAGTLLGVVYELTKEPIRRQEELTKTRAFQAVLAQADKFEQLELVAGEPSAITIKEVNKASHDGEDEGYTFVIATKEGYGGVINLAVGISKTGTITGVEILNHSETPGLGAKITEASYKNKYKDKTVDEFIVVKTGSKSDNEIDAIGGATITSNAVTNAVNAAINYYKEVLAKGVQ